ncbi:MAG: divalent-cation tolerance protein CutA [Planctomycetes bacterium]|nr:divalent-cation tolerance protein CutA [Planctomycetota bacterium]
MMRTFRAIRAIWAMATSSDSGGLESGLVEIRTTFGTRAAAVDCARRLVTARLAACVQVDGPLTSTYRWQQRVETAEEWRCTCKTTATRRDACVAGIRAGHEYETPQVTIHALAATASYAAWVRESVENT